MQKTHVARASEIPSSLEPVFAEFNAKLQKLDQENQATAATTIDWTDMARAAVTWARSDNAPVPVEPTSLLQEIKAAKNAILRDPKTPQYITEQFLDEFIDAAVSAANSKAASVKAARNGNDEIVLG